MIYFNCSTFYSFLYQNLKNAYPNTTIDRNLLPLQLLLTENFRLFTFYTFQIRANSSYWEVTSLITFHMLDTIQKKNNITVTVLSSKISPLYCRWGSCLIHLKTITVLEAQNTSQLSWSHSLLGRIVSAVSY